MSVRLDSEKAQGHDREKAAFLGYQMLVAIPRAMVLGRPEYLGQADTTLMIARMLHALLTTRTGVRRCRPPSSMVGARRAPPAYDLPSWPHGRAQTTLNS